MAIVTIDFETFYSREYSLRRMSEVEYILDPRFQVLMCAIKRDDASTTVVTGAREVGEALRAIDWTSTAMLAHNTRFDGAIAAWHYGIAPALYLDTLGMARATVAAAARGASLAKVSDYLGLPPKGDEIVRMMGRTLPDFDMVELQAAKEYAARDNDNCYSIYQRLVRLFPASELRLMDIFLRMFIEPQVMFDPMVLAEHLTAVRAEKAAALARVSHIDRSVFSSNVQFARLLEAHGVEVPMKTSPTTGLETYALAKNDWAFRDLCEDPTQPPIVQALLAARLGVKSTIEETRSVTLLRHSQLDWHGRGERWAPVPLRYYGAHTGRVSGDGGVNWLNFKRNSPIRAAVLAPDGYRCEHRDASQIEARMVAWLSGCRHLLDAFAAKRDIYSEFASIIYGRPINKRDNPRERQVGKIAILGLGYGMGAPRFQHFLLIQTGIRLDIGEAARIVRLYRDSYPEVPTLWKVAAEMLRSRTTAIARAAGDRAGSSNGTIPGVTFAHDALWLPNGLCINYQGLRVEDVTKPDGTLGKEMVYDGGHGQRVKLFGGKIIENASQALARIIVTDTMVRMYGATGYHPFLHTYDSIDYCVLLDEVEEFDALLEHEFTVRPAWAPDLPLASDGGWGITLAAAEAKENR